MNERQIQLLAWAGRIEALVAEIKAAEAAGTKSRQQSLATTKLEEASHWLTDELGSD